MGPPHTLSAQLQLTEQFEESLPNSEGTLLSNRFGSTKNLKDMDNQARKHGNQSDVDSSVVEDLEEQLNDINEQKEPSRFMNNYYV